MLWRCVRLSTLAVVILVWTSGGLGASEEPSPWIDRYGQNAKADWPQKIHSHDQLHKFDQDERTDLQAQIRNDQLDEFSAWKSGPTLRATGFFRLEKWKDRWWFVAANGHLFYSTGIDCIGQGHTTNLTEKNRAAYSWLPSSSTSNDSADGGLNFSNTINSKTANFYKINLIRKWDKQADANFLQRAIARQESWGFTTIGNWSDDTILAQQKMPYVLIGPKTWELKIPFLDGDIPDVYHKDFRSEAFRVAAQLADKKSDKWLVGYFIDNELPWWNIPYDVLALDDKQPARISWTKQLQKKYPTIEQLNKAWSTNAKSYSELRWPGEKANATAKKDMAALMEDFAERFYSTWYKAVKQADPNHLILGSRIPYPMDEVVFPCARHTDVLSFNHYAIELSKDFDRYYKITGKPILIGEYGFDSLDAGLKSAYVPVRSQADRARGFTYYTEQAAAKPYMVGTHYFQYIDEPLTGRGDGETSFNGFVSIADVPYPHLVSAARKTNKRIYDIHSGRVLPCEEKPAR